MLSRRNLLVRSAGFGLLSLGAPAPGLWRQVAKAADPHRGLPILVVIELTGGNDGLNTVVPFAEDSYHKNRPTLRIEPRAVLKLDDRVGLHPAFKELHRTWEAGDLAVVQGVGYPNPNRSHTSSMEIWQTGAVGPAPIAGWLGRAADANPALSLCNVSTQSLPLALRGRRAVPQFLSSVADYRLAPGASVAELPPGPGADDPVLSQARRQFAVARELSARLNALDVGRSGPAPDTAASAAETLEGRLETIRSLIEADLPFRVYYTAQEGFDTHAFQVFTHLDLLGKVSRGVAGFLNKLKSSRLDERVVVLVFSEFGRRLKENASRGTDHGAAAPVFLAGRSVKGGLIGPAPDLAKLDDIGDPRYAIDFRDVYATVVRRWLGVDPEPILGKRNDSLALVEGT
jgi:uncharacterized protein (DUF1501 family)